MGPGSKVYFTKYILFSKHVLSISYGQTFTRPFPLCQAFLATLRRQCSNCFLPPHPHPRRLMFPNERRQDLRCTDHTLGTQEIFDKWLHFWSYTFKNKKIRTNQSGILENLHQFPDGENIFWERGHLQVPLTRTTHKRQHTRQASSESPSIGKGGEMSGVGHLQQPQGKVTHCNVHIL